MPDDPGLPATATEDIAAAARPKLNGFAAGVPVAPVVPRSLAEVAMVAAAIIKAGLTPEGYEDKTGRTEDERYEKTKAKVMIGIMKGAEVGLPPITALSAIAMIGNRPTVWGDGAIALVHRAGVIAKIESRFEGMPGGDSSAVEDHRGERPRIAEFPQRMTAVCRIWRKGQDIPYEGRFSVQDAMRAHLWGNVTKRPWIEYPKRMLMARARAYALREGFADCLMGLSIREEIEDLSRQAPRTDTAFLEDAPAPSRLQHAKDNGAGVKPEPVRPPRSAAWEATNYELKVRKNTRRHADWRRLYEDLLSLIGEAETETELEQLQRDNARTIHQIGLSVPRGREILDQAFASRAKAMRGE
jgi:hypothetical protein